MRKLIVFAVLLIAGCTGGSVGSGGGTSTPAAAVAATVAATSATGAAATSPTSTSQSDVEISARCTAPATPTTESTEGPYFKAGSPEKASLVTAGMEGTRITLIGVVLTKSCKPVAGAKVDIWQANAKGEYDNSGYTLRGYVRTDANGQYRIETIVPGLYPGRTPHIHVKVEPPGGRVLTTQLYMPNVPSNAGDGIFRQDLVMQITQGPPMTGAFVFIVDLP
jgi:protocatechuate 3,4-dioxygenase beta subunit